MDLILSEARVIDGMGGKYENASLIIEGERIREVFPGKVPDLPGFTRVDCRGKTVMPGMIDTHVHVSGGDVVPGVEDFRVSRRMDEHMAMHAYRSLEAAQRALRAGFTTLRDMSSRDFVDVQLRNAISEGLVAGPRMVCSGVGITMTGGHVWRKCVQVDGRDEIRKEVRRQIREGVDWIKVMGVTGGVASPGQDIRKTQFTHEEICAAVAETHRLGRFCGAHVHGAPGIASCVEAGMDTIEHGTFLDDSGAEKMAAQGIYLVPTLLVSYSRVQGGADKAVQKREDELKRMGIRVPKPEERMALAKRHGVKVVVGSDCGGNTLANFGNHGIELLMLSRSGFTNMETLVAATSLAAEALRLTEVTGALKPGLAADVLIVDGNPLEDISVLTPDNSRVETVIKGGKAVGGDLPKS
ncbi:MAG TPA: amidohydrolase family protein [Thermodesulfobacteriota bacterium]|nr:amidohydrolase family protein [Thermodesulfobacteriota bacterium]